MDPYMTELFGRGNHREGLLHWLRDGTLVINNVHKVGGGDTRWGQLSKGARPAQDWGS
jgi:hypothetical protein